MWTTLGEVCTKPQYGYTTKAVEKGSGPRFLRITDLSKGWVDWGSVPYCLTPPEHPEKYLLKTDDLLVARAGSVGKAYRVNDPPKAVFASYLIRFRSLGPSVKYLEYFLQSPAYWRQIEESTLGITIPNVNASKLSELLLPLAPTVEQERIVAEIEKQFTRLDAAVSALRRVQGNLARYKAAVLKAACEGRLVAQDPNDEPASELLARISAERRRQWEASDKKGKYREPVGVDVDAAELPVGWVWVTIDQIVEVATGATPKRDRKEYWDEGVVPWITSSVVNELFVRTADESITKLAVRETNAKVFPSGTLLVAMYGEGKTRGKVTEMQLDAATNQALAALLFQGLADRCKPYIKLFMQKNYEDIRRLSSGGVQPNLNLSIIRSTILPLPPLAYQERVVKEVERRLSIVQVMEQVIKANLIRAERLRQGILQRAFSGRLV